MKFFLFLLVSANVFAMDKTIYPLAVGNDWTYEVTSTYPFCPSGKRTAKVVRETETSGRKAFELSGPCSGSSAFLSVSGENVDSVYAGTWWRMISEPVKEGADWEEFRTRAVWQSAGKVTVQAGTFDDCWKKTRKVTYTDWSIYCRGVGLVRSYMKDLGGGSIAMELSSYSVR